MRIVLFLLLVASISGCVGTAYHKSVTVHKNAKGEIEQIVVVEELTQPNRTESPWPFKYLGQ